MIPTSHYLFLSLGLFTIGVIGVVMGASSVVIHHELTGFGQKALITGVGAMMAGFAPGVLTALGIGAAVV